MKKSDSVIKYLLSYPLVVGVLSIVVYVLFYRCINEYLGIVLLALAAIINWFFVSRYLNKKRIINSVGLLFVGLILILFFLASQNQARTVTADASIKQSLINTKSEIERSFSTTDSFESACQSVGALELADNIKAWQLREVDQCYGLLLKLFIKDKPLEPVENDYYCKSDSSSYKVRAYIPSEEAYYCVSNTESLSLCTGQ